MTSIIIPNFVIKPVTWNRCMENLYTHRSVINRHHDTIFQKFRKALLNMGRYRGGKIFVREFGKAIKENKESVPIMSSRIIIS